MSLVDTHCHIHEADYPGGGEAALERARNAGVSQLVCVGTDETTSAEAVQFVHKLDNTWASIGIHPHEAKNGMAAIGVLRNLLETSQKIVAIGECGLDFFYDNSPREQQIEMLHAQLRLAREYDLPVIFHVREAFDDFWPIFDIYKPRGVLHSFTDTHTNLERAIASGLYIGVNGISTFTKVDKQREMYRSIPLSNMVLETDAPFLTPVPKRGSINEPAFVTLVASFIANLQSITLEELSHTTSQNALRLFNLKQTP